MPGSSVLLMYGSYVMRCRRIASSREIMESFRFDNTALSPEDEVIGSGIHDNATHSV